ncbi:MAG: OsmC family protein [Myxococcales bacterium]|nr:MAG: OsmC family protein [Myxococcales bacterium]
MEAFPHHYKVNTVAKAEGEVATSSEGLADIAVTAPAEFGGDGKHWSPETLLVAAVADCFVLSFKAIARASRFEWHALRCEVEGVLDRDEKILRFVQMKSKATLEVKQGADLDKARRLLDKAEHNCLITNSLNSEFVGEFEVLEIDE